MFLTFASNPRNVHLTLIVDCVDPFKLTHSTWSTWHVTLLNYKLYTWLTSKKIFILLALLIIRKDSMTLENFDVYLQPLVDELQKLWIGVYTYDVLKPLGSRSFTLEVGLLWTIHDFLRYGIVVGVTHQGYCACPICGPNFKGEHSMELGKMTYTNTHRWLPVDHPYKSMRMKGHFNGQLETSTKLKIVTIEEQLVRALEPVLVKIKQ